MSSPLEELLVKLASSKKDYALLALSGAVGGGVEGMCNFFPAIDVGPAAYMTAGLVGSVKWLLDSRSEKAATRTRIAVKSKHLIEHYQTVGNFAEISAIESLCKTHKQQGMAAKQMEELLDGHMKKAFGGQP